VRVRLALLIAVAAALMFVPNLQNAAGFSTYYLLYAYFLFFWIAQATSWNILSGYSGYFSFGQGAFYGLGVYTAGVLFAREGMNYFLTIPIAGLLGGALALAVGALAFRLSSLRGEIFALLTLAVTFTLASVVALSERIDGGQGVPIPVPDYPDILGDFQDLIYRLGLAVAALAVISAFLIQHSRFGWGLFSIRDEEGVAEELGVPTFRYKMFAITISGALGALSGAVATLQIGYLTPDGVFNLTVPLLVIVMSVLGGRRHWLGPIIGALIIYSLQERLTNSDLEEYGQIVLGAILVVIILFAPEGLYERLRQPVRAVLAAIALVAGTAVAAITDWGIATDWLSTGLAAATVVLLVPWPKGRQAGRRKHTATPSEEAPAR
jgi:branched-chain amino acid transport system permease protein